MVVINKLLCAAVFIVKSGGSSTNERARAAKAAAEKQVAGERPWGPSYVVMFVCV